MTIDIDPEILLARIEQARHFPAFDVTKMSSAEGRRIANAAASYFNNGLPEIARVEEWTISTPGGPIRLRLYEPHAPRGKGGVFYIHGGGWYCCDVDTHDCMLRTLARDTSVCVLGIDYRLSPEHPFPAALDDCLSAWAWLQAEGPALSIDPARVALCGDSAGANIALALSLRLRDAGLSMPVGAALLYGCFAPALDTESATVFGQGGYGLTAERMRWYWDNYLGKAKTDPPLLAMPLHADLAGLPPIFMGIAEVDTVADDSRLLLASLQQVGVTAELLVWRGAVHGFLQMTRDVALARAAVADTADALRRWVG